MTLETEVENRLQQAVTLPFSFARDQQVILDGAQIIVGPKSTDLGLREAIRRISGPDCEAPSFVEASETDFENLLSRIYNDTTSGNHEDGSLLFELEDNGGANFANRDLLEDAGDAPVVQLVNQLLRRAVTAGASDLHIEPYEHGLRARIRVDGFLQKILDRSDVPVRRVVSRLKVMAGLDIAETRLPQDGRIPLSMGGRLIDTRVSSLPGNYGERIVLRILDRSTGLMKLTDLGLSKSQVSLLERLSSLPNGIILATGPTGAGKTTTLYSLLKLADRYERNIVTVEDPIEYDLPGISQSQINADIGMTFANGLRATLRQDPDVILVGEIRDNETGSVASQAALTGHLVFSSLHANSSVGAVVRLRDLGIDNFLIAATLRGVVAQRLLRRLCPSCCKARIPTSDDAQHFRKHAVPVPAEIFDAIGCNECDGVGYRGRIGIFEMVEIGESLRVAIDKGASEAEMRSIALSDHETLIGQGLEQVTLGMTSLSETLRVVGDVA
ncbi:MAG: GspE/PulE family protein [Vibrio splendidus]